jgi:hypothetical protein
MHWPLVTRKRYEEAVNAQAKLADAVTYHLNEAAKWRVEYRKVRDWVVDTAVNYAGNDPRIKGLFAQAATMFGQHI